MTVFPDDALPAVGSPEFRALIIQTRARLAALEREGPPFASQRASVHQRLRDLLARADAELPAHVNGAWFSFLLKDARDEASAIRGRLPGSSAAEAAAGRVEMLVAHYGRNTRT
jgi:hypothetical protein